MKDQKKTGLVFWLGLAQRAVDRWIENQSDRASGLSAAQAGTMFSIYRNATAR
jgi:hypothetical protein